MVDFEFNPSRGPRKPALTAARLAHARRMLAHQERQAANPPEIAIAGTVFKKLSCRLLSLEIKTDLKGITERETGERDALRALVTRGVQP